MSNIDEIKNKHSLYEYLNKRVSTNQQYQKELVQKHKQLDTVNTIMGNFCGTKCLNNFGENSLTPQEDLSLSQCAKNFYDSLEKGEINLKNMSKYGNSLY